MTCANWIHQKTYIMYMFYKLTCLQTRENSLKSYGSFTLFMYEIKYISHTKYLKNVIKLNQTLPLNHLISVTPY